MSTNDSETASSPAARHAGRKRSERDVLLLTTLYAPAQQRLEQSHVVHHLHEARDRDALLTSLAERCEIVVTSGAVGIDAATMAKLPKLRLVSCFGVGVDAIDLDYCNSHGITVTNTPGVLTDDVADLALALLLTTLRRITEGDRFVRAGRWLKESPALGTAMRGTKVGIVGMGRIGQAIATRCAAFGCELAYNGPRPKDVVYRYEKNLIALAEWADVLIAALPGGGDTDGTISAQVLDALGPRGQFINIARGSVVDQAALVERLLDGRLGGAGLDVFRQEPTVPEELIRLGHVVLLPHIGSATCQTRQAMGDLTVDNVDAWVDGKPLPTPVNG